jgi:hypothetical protein
MTNEHETGAAIVAKAALPVGISLATVLGFQVSDILMWMTLIYTFLLIVHKIYLMYKDFRKK